MNTALPHFLNISIRDPIQAQDRSRKSLRIRLMIEILWSSKAYQLIITLNSFGSYINYQIVTDSNIPGYVKGETSIGRRYSDFTWLSAELSRFCAGVIVPALPEKQTVGRFSTEFVEARRRSLERFLLRIAAHQELKTAPVFIVFLQSNEESLKEAKEASKSGIKKISASLTSWFEGKVNSLSTGKVTSRWLCCDICKAESTDLVLTFWNWFHVELNVYSPLRSSSSAPRRTSRLTRLATTWCSSSGTWARWPSRVSC